MTEFVRKFSMLVTKVVVPEQQLHTFGDWQSRLNSLATAFRGFVSLEFSTDQESKKTWIIVQRFETIDRTNEWLNFDQRLQLMHELKSLVGKNSVIKESVQDESFKMSSATEVIITEVMPEKEDEYRKWTSKIHQAEAKFPGFKGVYVQSPTTAKGHHWITFLQFDTTANLDRWLESNERLNILKESGPLIAKIENHRMISPFSGWFASIAKKGEIPPVWKQTMIILLVLFPIVMLEMKFLAPRIASLNSSLATFIGNAISVTLVSYPMLPIVIGLLGWWLIPPERYRLRNTIIGTVVVLFLYFVEVILLWNLLK